MHAYDYISVFEINTLNKILSSFTLHKILCVIENKETSECLNDGALQDYNNKRVWSLGAYESTRWSS